MIGFSNGAGGEIFIGINDKEKIIGLNEDDLIEIPDKISDIIYSLCYPIIIPDIFIENINDKKVIIVKVYPGNLKPYYIKSMGKNNGTYIRIGSENKKADFEFIQELERKRMNIGYDYEINYINEFQKNKYKFLDNIFKERLGRKLTTNDYKNLELVKKEHEKAYSTNALLILAGEMNNTSIDCARFKGKTKDIFIDSKEFTGNLFDQLKGIEKFLKNHLNLSSEIKGFIREDKYEIPIEALREAILNAMIHRDYSRKGSNIKIAIYDDIVEITSPGVLPASITLYDIFTSKRSESRNKIISRIFKELGYIEQGGTGMNKIFNLCKEAGLKAPEVKEIGYYLQIIFYRNNYLEIKTPEKHRKNTGKTPKKHRINNQDKSEKILYKNEIKIIEYLKEKEKITNEIARKITGLKENGVKTLFRRLLEKKYIEKQGKTKGTYYKLKSPE